MAIYIYLPIQTKNNSTFRVTSFGPNIMNLLSPLPPPLPRLNGRPNFTILPHKLLYKCCLVWCIYIFISLHNRLCGVIDIEFELREETTATTLMAIWWLPFLRLTSVHYKLQWEFPCNCSQSDLCDHPSAQSFHWRLLLCEANVKFAGSTHSAHSAQVAMCARRTVCIRTLCVSMRSVYI